MRRGHCPVWVKTKYKLLYKKTKHDKCTSQSLTKVYCKRTDSLFVKRTLEVCKFTLVLQKPHKSIPGKKNTKKKSYHRHIQPAAWPC